jgi:hypothetical protein
MKIMRAQSTAYDLQAADAALLLDAPRREAPDVCDTSRPNYSYGLILVLPIALIVAAFTLLTRLTPTLLALPRW